MNFKNCYRPEDVYIFCQKFTKIRDKNGCVVLRNDVIYGKYFKRAFLKTLNEKSIEIYGQTYSSMNLVTFFS